MPSSLPLATLEKFSTFGDLLRYLRRAAGLTQLELSIQVGYSHAQISRLEQNLRLPDIPTIEARFVPALGLGEDPKAVARLLDLAANVRREDAPGPGLCPYKGLNYFDEGDADLFVGREDLTARLTERILALTHSRRPHEMRFLAVVGASGSGKSSLVRAGIVPALHWHRKSADWHIHILTPAAHPLQSLAASLMHENEPVSATATLMDDFQQDPRSLHIFAGRKLRSEKNGHLLLVIDQFEELFTLCRSEEERKAFIGNLLTAASETGGSVSVVITLRADFYANCAVYLELREALAQNQEYIGAMTPQELRRAIEEPAQRSRWELEPGLVELLLREVGSEPGALPLLAHALFETWQRRRGRLLTLGGYASSGGVHGAIAETAENVFTDQFTHEQQIIARRIFLRLTELGDNPATADTRRRAPFHELILNVEEAPAVQAILTILADARLVITNEDSVEVVHEALIREWPTLRGWLAENRESLRLHRQIADAAQEWSALKRVPDVLYRGARLAQAHEWASLNETELNSLEREFLTASIRASEQEAAAREAQHQRELENAKKLAEVEGQRAEENKRTAKQLRKRSLYLAGAFGMALLLALATLLFGLQAQKARLLATSRELAAASVGNLDIDPERSILLALKAVEASYTIEAEDALHRALQASRVQLVLQTHETGAPASVAFRPDGKQIVTASVNETAKVLDAATGKLLFTVKGHFATYTPDGKQLATVIADGTVKLWDANTGREIRLPGPIDAGIGLDFNSDGSRVATVVSGNLPKIWDAKTGKELLSFAGHTDFVGFARFDAGGARLLTASDDGTARVWDTHTGRELLQLADHAGWVWNAAFSPDGKRIATVSGNNAYLWDATSGKRLFVLAGHQGEIYSIAFSPDGTRLATAGADRKIKVWNATTGQELFTLAGHTGAIYGIDFSPDGSRLVSGSDDGTVRVWDLTPTHELMTLSTPDSSSGQIAFNAHGTRLATTDEKDAISIWDAHSGKKLLTLPNSGTHVKELAFSVDEAHVISAGADGEIKFWDLATKKLTRLLSTNPLNGMATTQDGQHLAIANDDYKARIWDIASAAASDVHQKPVLTLTNTGTIFSIAFNRDGSRLATGIQDGTTSLWDVTTNREIRILRGHQDAVVSIAFDPGGQRIATASLDATAKVWELASGAELFTLRGHTGGVTAIAFSPDGSRIATTSQDGTAKLWNAATGEELLTFPGDGSELNDIAFSPDGTRLAIGGRNGVRIYLLQIKDLVALAQTRVTRGLSSEECQRYLHSKDIACTGSQAPPTTTALPPATSHRICQVTNTAGLYDHSFNQLIFKGTQEAVAKFHWDAKIFQSSTQSDFEKNIRDFLRGDCDLIVGLPPMSDAMRLAAEANPGQKFQIMEFAYNRPLKNIWTEISATDQAAFLAGYVAASVTRTGKVGVFGGVNIPNVTDFMDGFVLGVAHYNLKNGTDIQVLGWDVRKHEGLFVGDFCCAAEGRKLTQELLNQGADIILPVAGTNVGPGALSAVQNHGKAYIIGVDTDWAITFPEYADVILTSITKNYDVSVLRAVQAIEDDRFSGGAQFGTLETGEVGLAPFHQMDTLVSAKVKADLSEITKDIIEGRVKTRP